LQSRVLDLKQGAFRQRTGNEGSDAAFWRFGRRVEQRLQFLFRWRVASCGYTGSFQQRGKTRLLKMFVAGSCGAIGATYL